MIKKTQKSGFTLIELSLSMVFLAILLLIMALITTQIIVIYQKGLAIKAVSSTGRELVDDISRAIAASPTKSTSAICSSSVITTDTARTNCENNDAFLFIYQQHNGKARINNNPNETVVPAHGAFCTGRYSYLWNTGYTLNENLYPGGQNYRATLKYKIKNSAGIVEDRTVTDYRLLKIRDQERTVCATHVNGNYSGKNDRTYNIGLVNYTPEELLTVSEDNLAIYDLKIFPPSQHFLSFHSFYSGTFILATIPGGVDITGSGDYCKNEPDGLNTDFAYCAINKFNFAMRATGETNDEEKRQQKQN
ncbi:prepilin-type N-terminal cleavage/methylation domain-containing protein [Candidatus Saccharibacteria bacterium]|nr:prepilin-type N-terminal cleavage/methylation domain-containing protein [Candidatus Saccharibacteria bacterium]